MKWNREKFFHAETRKGTEQWEKRQQRGDHGEVTMHDTTCECNECASLHWVVYVVEESIKSLTKKVKVKTYVETILGNDGRLPATNTGGQILEEGGTSAGAVPAVLHTPQQSDWQALSDFSQKPTEAEKRRAQRK